MSTNAIQLLPENVVHKIAAGEVVERPISVVKELVENSIDAGADRIEIKIEQGGIQSIVIQDNGCGIPASELSLALQRHATSKIRSAEDLFSLHTLGFRGEALPSIASVSDFCIETATSQSAPVGYVIKVQDGQKTSLQETAMSQGTRITVKDLFATIPVRKKFLKRPETEWSHISDYLTAMALGHLGVEWRVERNGRQYFFTPRVENARPRLLDIFGQETMESMYPLHREVSEINIHGWIGHPNFSSKTNRNLFVYVNGRYVRDRLLNHAIISGYRSLLMTQQYPMVLLHLEMAPSLVDVNVHPAKREVRFANGNAIHHLISETIHQALEKAPWSEPANSPIIESKKETAELPRGGVQAIENLPNAMPRPNFSNFEKEPLLKNVQTSLESYARQNLELDSQKKFNTPSGQSPAKIGSIAFASLRLIGQFQSTYLLCEHHGSLVLIDQHAAHERIGFEKFKKSIDSSRLQQQQLLEPLTFELNPANADRLRPCLDELLQYGFSVEEFGERTFVIKSYPTLLGKTDLVALLKEMAEKMQEASPLKTVEDRMDHILATMACHRQIRAHDHLSHEEMLTLLQDLEGTPRSYHCPHGRPVMVEISKTEIEKWFKRVV